VGCEADGTMPLEGMLGIPLGTPDGITPDGVFVGNAGADGMLGKPDPTT
jgi:hypothetical protein